jgi:hypothetical protein
MAAEPSKMAAKFRTSGPRCGDAHPRLSALPMSQRLTLPDHPNRKYSGGGGRKPRAHSERSALTQRTPARPAHHEIALMALTISTHTCNRRNGTKLR